MWRNLLPIKATEPGWHWERTDSGMKPLTGCQANQTSMNNEKPHSWTWHGTLTCCYQANRVRVGMRTMRWRMNTPATMKSLTLCQANNIKLGLIRRAQLHWGWLLTWNGIQFNILIFNSSLSKLPSSMQGLSSLWTFNSVVTKALIHVHFTSSQHIQYSLQCWHAELILWVFVVPTHQVHLLCNLKVEHN